jgi:hypothetical protein
MPHDFFLWDYVKSVAYGPTGQVDNVEVLKRWTTAGVASGTPEMSSRIRPENQFRLDI